MILVVDDDDESRTLLTAILTAEGYAVRAADGGELALASAAGRRPELIILDIRMPGMDGFEVCRRLKQRADTRDIPVIFLTASSGPEGRVEGLRLGAVDFITKPFHREELLARVRTHLALSRLRGHLEHQIAQRTAKLLESEERFQNMADAAPIMIWASGPDKLCTFLNRQWLEFTGRPLEEELGGGWVTSVHPDDRKTCFEAYSSAFDAHRSFEMEYRLRRADGEYRWVFDRGVPRFESGGFFAGYVGSCTDITDVKHNQDRLLARQKLESLGVMAAGVAHDFNNYLSNIYAAAELALSDMPPDAPGRREIEKIETVVGYATETVNLLMASAGAGIDSDALERVDLSLVVKDMLRVLPASISKRAVINRHLRGDLPRVRGNVAQIRQIVMNLIVNASEALEEGQGAITITTDTAPTGYECSGDDRRRGSDLQYVCLKVADTGCGMSAETRTRIFDQFFTTKSQGRGLGLSAVHGIVRSHGGSIHVVSAPGEGTTFEVLFPCASAAVAAATAAYLPRENENET